MWAGLCNAIGVPELIDDERFVDNNARQRNRAALDPQLDRAAGTWEAGELLGRLREAGVPCAPLNEVGDALSDPQVRHRGMVLDLPFGDASVQAVGDPIKITEPRRAHEPPPRLGENTVSVLREVAGLEDDEIEKLISNGAAVPAADWGAGLEAPGGNGRRPRAGATAAEPV
jgi:crotonobetainyl-CoA:carnitine CoA-transferase CaiB-like acyl-CoA transferase